MKGLVRILLCEARVQKTSANSFFSSLQKENNTHCPLPPVRSCICNYAYHYTILILPIRTSKQVLNEYLQLYGERKYEECVRHCTEIKFVYFPEASEKTVTACWHFSNRKRLLKTIKIKSLTLSSVNQTYRKREVFVICLQHLDKHTFLKNDK